MIVMIVIRKLVAIGDLNRWPVVALEGYDVTIRQVRAIVLGSLCLLPCHDNDPDGISPDSDSVVLSEGGPISYRGCGSP
jgi:hypothetical protein